MSGSALLVYALLRPAGFLPYAGFIATYAFWLASFEGLLSTWVWPDADWWIRRDVHVSGVLCVAAGLVFARNYLATWRYAPRLDTATAARGRRSSARTRARRRVHVSQNRPSSTT